MNRRAIWVAFDYVIIDGHEYPAPEITTLPDLLNRVARQYDREGILLLTGEAAKRLGLPVTEEDKAAYQLPDMGGWRAGRFSDWTTFTHDHHPTVIMGIEPLIDRDACPFLAALWPTDIVAAFKGWHDLTGRAWHRTAGVAGLSVMRSLFPSGKQTPTAKPPALADAVERPYYLDDFRGSPADVEVQYDKTRAYIGAAQTVHVASATLRSTGKTFDPARAGWWRVRLGGWSGLLPNPAGYGETERWVTTPTLTLLSQLLDDGDAFVDFEILESRTAPGKPLLRPWADRMRDAYDGAALLADPFDRVRVRQAVKDAGRATLGMLAAPANWLYRPDWWAAIIAQHRSNMFRTMAKIGTTEDRWPTQVNVDAIWYPQMSEDPEQDAPKSLVIGDRLGQWKCKGTRVRKAEAK